MPNQATTDLVRQIANIQGVIFLKDLLRRKKKEDKRISVGVTKQEVLRNLIDAVENEIVTESDLKKWLDEVEGRFRAKWSQVISGKMVVIDRGSNHKYERVPTPPPPPYEETQEQKEKREKPTYEVSEVDPETWVIFMASDKPPTP